MSEKPEKKKISISLTLVYIHCLDQLIDVGVYADRAEAIKDGLRRIFRQFEMPPFAVKKPEEQ